MSKGASISPRKEWTIPVVVAIIGVSGTIVPILISPILSGFSGKPDVDIDSFVTPGSVRGVEQQVNVSVYNKGSSPATNVTLIVDVSPLIMEDFRSDLGTVEAIGAFLTTSPDSPVKFVADIPKLNYGSGAKVVITFTVTAETSDFPYSVSVIYNEGSVGKSFPTTPSGFVETYGVFGTIFLVVVYFLTVGLFSIFYLRRFKRKRLTTFVSSIFGNILEIRRSLKKNINTDFNFDSYWVGERYEKDTKKYKKYIQEKAPLDYILLYDFYTKLDERNQSLSDDDERNQSLSDDNNPQELENLNEDLIQLADNALQNIDWEKYTS